MASRQKYLSILGLTGRCLSRTLTTWLVCCVAEESFSKATFTTLRGGEPLDCSQEHSQGEYRSEQHQYHIGHCFDYLHYAVMYAGETTLKQAKSTDQASRFGAHFQSMEYTVPKKKEKRIISLHACLDAEDIPSSGCCSIGPCKSTLRSLAHSMIDSQLLHSCSMLNWPQGRRRPCFQRYVCIETSAWHLSTETRSARQWLT